MSNRSGSKPAASKPKLGQNFLRDDAAVGRIVSALGDLSARTVIEIGPGRGAITNDLAARAGRLIAVELDRELAWHLQERFSPQKGFPSVTVARQDVLQFDFSAQVSAASAGESRTSDRLLVVGNLPYYITSPILLHMAAHARSIERAVLMVQREVADRVTARPGSRDYGLLSVTLQLYGRTEALFTLPPEAFHPPPEVHSTVFRWSLAPRFAELGVEERPFLTFLRHAFAQKRKTLSNNLRAAQIAPAAINLALEKSAISAMARAETLSVEEFARLYLALQ